MNDVLAERSGAAVEGQRWRQYGQNGQMRREERSEVRIENLGELFGFGEFFQIIDGDQDPLFVVRCPQRSLDVFHERIDEVDQNAALGLGELAKFDAPTIADTELLFEFGEEQIEFEAELSTFHDEAAFTVQRMVHSAQQRLPFFFFIERLERFVIAGTLIKFGGDQKQQMMRCQTRKTRRIDIEQDDVKLALNLRIVQKPPNLGALAAANMPRYPETIVGFGLQNLRSEQSKRGQRSSLAMRQQGLDIPVAACMQDFFVESVEGLL